MRGDFALAGAAGTEQGTGALGVAGVDGETQLQQAVDGMGIAAGGGDRQIVRA